MTTRIQFHSLRGRFTVWFLIIAILPLALFALFDYFGELATIEGFAEQKLVAIRDLKTRELEHWLDERIGDMNLIASGPAIVDIARKAKRESGRVRPIENATGIREYFKTVREHYSAYLEVMLVDAATGVIVLGSDPSDEGGVLPDAGFLERAIRLRDVVISDVMPGSTADKEPEMYGAIPVLSGLATTADISLVLVVKFDLRNSLFSIIDDHTGMGKTGETLIINKDGYAVSSLRHQETAALNLRIDALPAQMARKGQTGIVQAIDYRGMEVLAAYTFLRRFGWGFVSKQDVAELHEPFYRRMTNFYLWIFVGAALAAIIAYILAQSTTRPLQRLVSNSRRIAEGAFDTRVEDQRLDELGNLAQSFNTMAAEIELKLKVAANEGVLFAASVDRRDTAALGAALSSALAEMVDAMIVAFYLRDQDGENLLPIAAVGSDLASLPVLSVRQPSGQLGLACVRQHVSFVRLDEPLDLVFETIAGIAKPRETAAVPLMDDGVLLGAVLIAKPLPFTQIERETISGMQGEVTSMLLRVLAQEARDSISNELRDKNQELEGMTEELQQQSEELQYQNLMLAEQKRQLEKANKLKGEFLSNMSHELRTPLNAIMSLSRALSMQTGTRLTEEEKDYLAIVQRNAHELLDLINDLLNLARIESGKVELQLLPVDPGALLRASVETIRPLAEEKGLDLRIDIPEFVPEALLDHRSVQMILQNILGNAVKYTMEGSVSVRLLVTNDNLHIEIEDTGIGIPEADLPYVFDEFRQVDGSASRKFEGVGLGLTIASKAAAMLRGRIDVRSKVGVGSTFIISLPLQLPADDAELQGDTTLRTRGTGNGGRRLLIIEDNDAVVMQLKGVLRDEGFLIEVVSDGSKAMETIRSWKPDTLLLDLMLPGIDGMRILAAMRADPALRELPVIILTAKSLTPDEWSILHADPRVRLLQKGSIDEEDLLLALYSVTQSPRDSHDTNPRKGQGDT
jgi:signal transduction histidine kinase